MIEIDRETILNRALAAMAELHIGIREVGGENQGQMVKRFQRSLDGKAVGEPWCAAFVCYCILETQRLIEHARTGLHVFSHHPKIP